MNPAANDRFNRVTRRETTWRETTWRVLSLGVLFFLVYGSVNQVTAMLGTAPSLYLPWETRLPFIEQMIIPYMSLDILFVIAVLLCRNKWELKAHSSRVIFAIVISSVIFLLFPLQFGFVKPEVDGFNGWLFGILHLDLPYNQCPSLHVSLSMIIWQVFDRRLQGVARYASTLWFTLIVMSTVFVYQHHVIDIAGGLVVGALAMYLFPLAEIDRVKVTARHRQLGRRYLFAALGLLAVVLGFSGWSLLLLYPAVSFALLASVYFSGRSNFLQKHNGRIPGLLQILFAPYLKIVCWTWKHYRKRDSHWAEVIPGLMLGQRLNKDELAQIAAGESLAVLDLAPEVKTRLPAEVKSYLHIPVLDFTAPDAEQIRAALQFIEAHKHKGKVYVHCALGYWRSAAVVALWLMSQGNNIEQAIDRIKSKRPKCIINKQALLEIVAA